MNSLPEPAVGSDARPGNLLVLALLAPLVGAVSGFLGAMFRLTLLRADLLRDAFIYWAHAHQTSGVFFVTFACAAAAASAAWLVRRFSSAASGSGIPQVEAELAGEAQEARYRVIPVIFAGGLLAIGGGLALGREGPSVHMGSSVASLLGRIFRRNWPDCRVLLAAGAGAGLATAFNAPIAGAIFVLEELVRRFEPRIAIVALGASSTAVAVARLFLGDSPDFHVMPLAFPPNSVKLLFFVLGIVAGLLAIAYNRAILRAIKVNGRLRRFPVELRAGVIGGAIGILAYFAPRIVGGGDPITQQTLLGAGTLATIPLLFLVRFCLGPISYGAATPGGLFAPLLVLGAQLGLFFGRLCQFAFPNLNIQAEGFAVVGMAAFFAGVVRAPLTGIVLVTEMTGNVSMLLPMLGACFASMLLTTALRNPPIYDSLREIGGQFESGTGLSKPSKISAS